MRIAIIGSGVAGIAAAKTLARLDHEAVVFERSGAFGGVWTEAYAGVHLQVLSELYAFTDFPWPFTHNDYPSSDEVRRYIAAAVEHYGLDIKLNHEVVKLEQAGEGWLVTVRSAAGEVTLPFDAVVVASGNYTGEKSDIETEGRERFKGEVITQHEVGDFDRMRGKRVAVVGFGKSAIDMVSFAVGKASEVHHVFRGARWLVPETLFGMPTSRFSTSRMASSYAASWVHPDKKTRRTLERFPWASEIDTAITGFLIRMRHGLFGLGRSAAERARLKLVEPNYPMSRQLRGTLAPKNYYPGVASGAIEVHPSAVTGFSETALLLADGSAVECDAAIFAIGYKPPALPFLPELERAEIAAVPDGMQLYRHIIHPRLRRLAFVGFNHNPMHIPTSEMSTLWLDAVLRGDLELPSPEEMEASTARVQAWKRANTNFEPTRGYFIGTHLHNYFDVLLGDLGLNSHRKRAKWRDAMQGYVAADYAGIIDEYKKTRGTARRVLPFDT